MKNIAIFASGNGTNFETIVEAVEKKELNANIVLLVCDKPGAYVLERARNHHISAFSFKAKDYASKEAYETEIVNECRKHNVDLIVLAGYMRILSTTLIDNFKDKIINIHPSLLPAFKGSPHAILDAYNYGVKVFGVTIHYVNLDVDGGKIIAQESFPYVEGDTYEEVENKTHRIEHQLYVKTIKKIIEE